MKGWKTWAAAVLMMGYGIAGIFLDLHDADTGVRMVTEGLAIVGLGHKIEKAAKQTS